MDKYDLYNKAQHIFTAVAADELPDLHSCLASIIEDGEIIAEDYYTIANELLQCDKAVTLPKMVRDFIEELFNCAFEEGNADAMNDIGAQYYDGSRGFPQDFSKAPDIYASLWKKPCRAGGATTTRSFLR